MFVDDGLISLKVSGITATTLETGTHTLNNVPINVVYTAVYVHLCTYVLFTLVSL